MKRACLSGASRGVGGLLAVLWLAAALTACGGGGGGGGGGAPSVIGLQPTTPVTGTSPAAPTTPAATEPIVASSTVAGQCAAAGTGTSTTEKRWVRAWIDETYLWYDEVPVNLLSTDYATPVAYFNVLKTPKLTASGRAKDRFHFTEDTAAYQALSQTGVEVGYGFEYAYLSTAPPRDVRVAYTEAGSPASQAAIERGTRLVEVDGIDVANGTDVAGLNAGLTPAKAGELHTFKLRALDDSERSVTLTSARVTRAPVQNVKAFPTAGGTVGYLLFNDQLATAEAALIAAVEQLKAAAIVDLVVDMRYNGGGLLDIASEFATMISSPAATNGAVFERLQFNSKNPFGFTVAQTTLPFHVASRGFSTPAGQQLPRLGLSRVTVLVGPDTCSASESIVNSLRGVGVAVDLVGGTTCGKPYGFYPQDNCGTTYFSIQFQGVNQQGFGDYGDGLAPTCAVADDFTHSLGDPAEARLAAALALRGSGVCPAAPAGKTDAMRMKAEAEGVGYLQRSPVRENRLVTLP